MKYSLKVVDGIAVIYPETSLDFIEFSEVKNIFRETYHLGIFKIIINLKSVSTINSTAVGLLISESVRLKIAGGRLALCSINPFISRIFSIVGADEIIRIYGNVAKAIEGLKSEKN